MPEVRIRIPPSAAGVASRSSPSAQSGKAGLALSSLGWVADPMMKPSRPSGVAVLAVLDLIVGILAFIGGVFMIAVGGSGLLSTVGYGAYSGFAVGFGAFAIIVGLFAVVVGWGMWSGRTWAWLLAVVLYAIGILFGFTSLAAGSLSSIVGLVIDVFLLWYMFRPHVKAFFGRGTPLQPAPGAQPVPPTV